MGDIHIIEELEKEIKRKLERKDEVEYWDQAYTIDSKENINQLSLGNLGLKYLPPSIQKMEHLHLLSLTHNQLTSLPEEIAQLQNLQVLRLSDNQLTSLPKEVASLQNLQKLRLSGNQLKTLPKEIALLQNLQVLGLGGNQLTSLPKEITQLQSLRQLGLGGNRLSSLPKEIAKLQNLQVLWLDNNQLTSLPKEIAPLQNLRVLWLDNNQLTSLPKEIAQLQNLQELGLGGNQLVSLPKEIALLQNLKVLRLNSNQLTSLPREILQLNMEIKWDWDSTGIILGNNPLESPPIEIVKHGKKAVENYFRAENKVKLYEAKLLIVGRGEVGKTCLMNKIINPHYKVNTSEKTTKGVDIVKWPIKAKVDNKKVDFTINFWDFGGQEIYHATHQFFLTKSSLYLFIWDARKEEDYPAFDYWLNIIKLLSNSSPILMVLNKVDERIKEIEQESLKKKFPNIQNFYKVSALKDTGIADLRKNIMEYITQLPHIGAELPKVWTEIRNKLENRKENYITYTEFKKLCKEFNLNEEQAHFLSDYYHDLGVFLHFKDEDLLEDIVILKPQWATDAVYKVLDDPVVRNAKGKFSRDDLKKIWINYETDKHPQLLRLMEKFELCFKIGDTPNYVAPELMPADPPSNMLTNTQGALRFEYKYDFMPAGIITRLIVRQHYNIEGDSFFKNGVVFKYDDATATVLAEPLNRRIKIIIKGENKTGALAIIRNEIGYIHKTLNNPDVREMIPCICRECKTSPNPHFYKFDMLKKFLSKGKEEVACENSAENVRIKDLLQGIKYTQQESPYTSDDNRWDVFISYSAKDAPLIQRIISNFKERGIPYWLDEEQIFPGDSIIDKIEHGLKKSRYVLACFSYNQINSGWCREEYKAVLYQQFSQKSDNKVIPLILDDLPLDKLPPLLGDRLCTQYTDKKEYQKLLNYLVQKKI